MDLHTIVVEVSGTSGQHFRGEYRVGLGSSDGNAIPLEGTVPTTEDIRDTFATRVRATMRKMDPGAWRLTLRVQLDGQRACETTTAELGQVTATASLPGADDARERLPRLAMPGRLDRPCPSV